MAHNFRSVVGSCGTEENRSSETRMDVQFSSQAVVLQKQTFPAVYNQFRV